MASSTAAGEVHYHDWRGSSASSEGTLTTHRVHGERRSVLEENLPDELKSYPQWVVWKYEDHGKPKRDKVLYNPRTGQRAKSNDPQTWVSFAESLTVFYRGGFDGVGFVFSKHDPYVGIDLDSCRDPTTGTLEAWAGEIIERLDSYTEASPSGTGVHILTRGTLPASGRKKDKVEMYSEGRFFTVTGEHIGGTPTAIEERTAALAILHAEVFGKARERSHKQAYTDNGAANGHSSLTDERLILLAKRARNGELFARLWTGDTTGYPSPSEADLALCNRLTFYCGRNPVQIDRLFRQSGLYREKWDKKHFGDGRTYGQATIDTALASGREFSHGAQNGTRVAATDEQESLPIIEVTNRPLREISDDALAALRKKNDPPFLFVRSGVPVRTIRDERQRPIMEPVGEAALRGYLTRSAEFVRVAAQVNKKPNETKRLNAHVSPPKDVVHDILSLAEKPFPPLIGIVECPVLRPDGTILDAPGYDPATRLYYEPAPGLSVPALLPFPTQDDAYQARAFLQEELLRDFPFVDTADMSNLLACLLTPVIRPAISGCVPLCLLDKPGPGSGATLLSDVVSTIATGEHAAKITAPEGRYGEPEWKKIITSLLLDGTPVVVFDNIEEALASSALSSVLTTPIWKDRILGQSATVTLPVRQTWIATANNISLRGDLARRCYRVRIDPQQERPWERETFRHPDLLGWTRAHRGDLLAALLHMARAWFVAGQPQSREKVPRLGGFEGWTEMVSGVLAYAGVGDFLANQQALYNQVDDEGPAWRAFLEAWHNEFGDHPVTVRYLAGSLQNDPANNILLSALPDSVGWDENHLDSSRRNLGNSLKKRRGRVYGAYRLEQGAADSHSKVASWVVKKCGV